MDILDKIVKSKKVEVALKKEVVPIKTLEASRLFERKTISMSQELNKSTSGIIAEHKRRSPSKSVINQSLSVSEVVKAYEKAGVSGISILTDGQYFGGSLDDLVLARASVNTSLLRKEFIIDEYQLIEAKSFGADTILLIAAILDKKELEQLSKTAKSLEMDVLLEVHNQEELQKSILPEIDMIGVNNRNLKTFRVDLKTSYELARHIPEEYIKVSESGISSIDAINGLKAAGFKGFLIGENFMRTKNPGENAYQFIKELNK
ncbi:indole-3-glycerol phosphate synthase TrpC [Eudoraea chungangensis]|uniref:indole-3-glycerol phosphate synthase TrpC n=1 Tax=Eudoraea chungangensis TaxID=1481905 RepID=UPI0023EB95F2|nr:indole-3-glycerol phosphate synthase TrpC [Eudoraea chungangensis]